jgi:hypothetical protein
MVLNFFDCLVAAFHVPYEVVAILKLITYRKKVGNFIKSSYKSKKCTLKYNVNKLLKILETLHEVLDSNHSPDPSVQLR